MDKEEKSLEELTDLFRNIFVDREIVLTPQTSAADLPGWDSMKHIEIVMAVEEKYRVRFNTQQVEGLRSVGDLVTLIDQKTS